jgi:molecular chaperone GrpE
MTDQPEHEIPISAAESTATASSESDAGDLKTALAQAEARATEHKDLYFRALAELENVRKRATRDIEQAHKYALEKFVGELLGVKDSLEMALATGEKADVTAVLAGTEATLKLLAKAFEKSGSEEIDPAGQPFNPELHEAMAMQESADQPANSVVTVIQRGYRLNGRLLRPARVIVARAPG